MPGSIPGSGRSSGKGTATHSSILAWKTLQTEEPGRLYSPWGRKELDTTEQLTPTRTQINNFFPSFHYIITWLNIYLNISHKHKKLIDVKSFKVDKSVTNQTKFLKFISVGNQVPRHSNSWERHYRVCKVYREKKEGAEEQIRLGSITTKASDQPHSSQAEMALQGCPSKRARSLMD